MKNSKVFEHVINAVQFSSGLDNLKANTRRREYVDARRIAYYILRNVHGFTFQSIAKEFNKNHASVIHGIRDFDFLLKSDENLYEIYNQSFDRIAQGDIRKEQIIEEIKQLQAEFLTLI
jgi:chromosomal replication initiation ATPase DnaA